MFFNKKNLALAIMSVLSSSAYAVVDLNTGVGAPVYASEEPVPGTGAILNTNTNILNTTVEVGFSITAGTSKYIRLDFTGAKVDGSPLTFMDFMVAGASSIVVSSGGTVGSSFVIIEVTAGAGIAANAPFTFTPWASSSNIRAMSQSPQPIKYALYETATAAVNQTAPLVSNQVTWYSFANALTASCTAQPNAGDKINVIKPTEFKSGLGNAAHPIYPLVLDVPANTYYLHNGSYIAMSDLMGNGTTIVMTGSMAGFTGTGYIDGDYNWLGNIAVDASKTFGTWTVPTNAMIPFDIEEPHFQPNNVDAMVPSTYSIKINPAGGAQAWAPTSAIDLGVCGKLVYSGSSDRVDLSLTPKSEGGSANQFVRITNPSDDSGKVNITLVNDQGKSVTFPLSAVTAGGASLSATLNKGASTPLIALDTLYAAGQAVDATFAVNTQADGQKGKLRVIVQGEFGDEMVDDFANEVTDRLKNGIYIQSVTNSIYEQTH